jgi:hypothetical protein
MSDMKYIFGFILMLAIVAVVTTSKFVRARSRTAGLHGDGLVLR